MAQVKCDAERCKYWENGNCARAVVELASVVYPYADPHSVRVVCTSELYSLNADELQQLLDTLPQLID